MKHTLEIALIGLTITFITACGGAPLAQPERNPTAADTVVEEATKAVVIVQPQSPLAPPTATAVVVPTLAIEEYPTASPPEPTPTATPINPKESEIAALDVPAGSLAISPDNQTLLLIGLGQLWTIDIDPKLVRAFDVYGAAPKWSPDGEQILFRGQIDSQLNQFELATIDRKGTNEQVLVSVRRDDLLDYYWLTNDQVALIKPDGMYEINQSDKSISKKVNLSLPAKTQAGGKLQVTGQPTGLIVASDSRELWSIRNNQQTQVAEVKPVQNILLFQLSPNEKQIAYVVAEGPNEELWIGDTEGHTPSSKLYSLEMGHIRSLTWSPDSQAVVFGWRPTGTSLGDDLILFWLDLQSGEVRPLNVHGVGKSVVFSHNGDNLYYGRTSYADPTDDGKTRIFQLRVK